MFGIFQLTDTEKESEKQKANPCFGGFSCRFRYEDSRGKTSRRKKLARIFGIAVLCVFCGAVGALSGVLIMNQIQKHQDTFYYSDDAAVSERSVPNEPALRSEAGMIVSAGFSGFRTEEVTEEIATRYRLPRGVRIVNVEADTNAFAAGLQSGDIIVAVNGFGVQDADTFAAYCENCREGDSVLIRVFRENDYEEFCYTVPAE